MNFPEEMKPYDDDFCGAAAENDLDDCLASRYSMDVSATQAVSFLMGSIYTHLDCMTGLTGESRGLAEFHAREIKEAIGYLLFWDKRSCETAMYDIFEQIDGEMEDETDEKTECGSTCNHDGQGID